MSKYEKPTLNEVEVEKIVEENQELKEDNLTYKHIIGDDLFFEDLAKKYKPCYEAMKIIKKKFFVDYNPNELGLAPIFDNGNPKYASITSEEYKIFRKVFEALENE